MGMSDLENKYHLATQPSQVRSLHGLQVKGGYLSLQARNTVASASSETHS